MDSKSKTKRIDELIKKIKQVASGDYSARIELSDKNDELDVLALNLNAMIDGIGRRVAKFDQTDKDLKKSEERYRKQIEGAMDAIVIADAETGIIIDCNRVTEELVGRKKSELIGQHQRILHPPQELDERFSKTFLRHRRDKEGQVLEAQVITKDGEIKDVAIKANVFELNGKKLIQGIFRDVTEYRKLVTDLEREKVLMDAMMDNFPEYIYFKDLDSNFLRISKVLATDVFGLTDPKEGIGKSDFDFFPREHAQKDYAEEQEIIKSGKPVVNNEVKTEWADGSVSWASITRLPLRNEQGQIIGTFGISRNITEHRKAEIELEHEKVLMDAMMNNFPEYIYFKDKDSNFLRISKVLATEVFGLTNPKQAIGKSDFDFFPREHAQKDYDQEQKIIKSGKPIVNNEVKTEWADGSVSWASITKMPLCDENGQIIGTFGVSRNITERKQIEESLEKERNLVNTILDSLPDAVYVKDARGRFLRTNKVHAKRWFGLDNPAKVVGKTDFDFFSKEHARQAYEDEQEIIKTGTPLLNKEEKETWHDRPDTWVLTSKIPLRDKEGKVIGTVGITKDITDRKQIEEALDRERNLLRLLLNNIPDRVYVKDLMSRFLIVNTAVLHKLNVAEVEDVIGKTDFDFYPQEYADHFRSDEEVIIQSGQPLINHEEFTVDAFGNREFSLATKVPMRDRQGKIIGLVGISRDITERKRAEEALKYEKSLLDGLMNNIPDSIYFKDRQCRLLKINRRMMETLNMTHDSEYFHKTDVELFGEEFGRKTVDEDLHLMETGEPIVGLVESRRLADGTLNWTSTTKVPIRDAEGKINGLVGITRTINDIKRAEEAREKVIKELQATIEKVNMLRGLIPICANCKKIRDDQGYWSNVESYIANHAEVEFTHGICPECMEKLYPDYVKKKKTGK
jgi:PAS domain S-box-containing protein